MIRFLTVLVAAMADVLGFQLGLVAGEALYRCGRRLHWHRAFRRWGVR